MILQHTTSKMLSLISIAPPCNAAAGQLMQIGLYESKMFNDKKYWPGLYRT